MRTSERVLSGQRLQEIDCHMMLGSLERGKSRVIKWILNNHFGGE